MALQTINIGTSANKGDGDPIRTAFTKVNANFTELFAKHDGTVATKADIQGSVFADDSTVIIDAVSSKVNLDGTVKGNIIPDVDVTYDIGSSTKRFKDLYLSGNTIHLGTSTLSVDTNGNFQLSGGLKSNNPIVGDDSTLLVDTANSSIPYAVLSGTPTIPSTTDNITEGTNLYYTDVRADARITNASTTDLSEGTNLYYTDARVDAKITALQTAGFDGDIKGSVFGDDSTLLVDGVNNSISYSVISGTPTTLAGYGITDGDAYTNSDVDTHLNQSNPTSGYVLSWDGTDYAWDAAAIDREHLKFDDSARRLVVGPLAGGTGKVEVGNIVGHEGQNLYLSSYDSGVESTHIALNSTGTATTSFTTGTTVDFTGATITGTSFLTSVPASHISIADLQILVAASTDFADFQTRIAAL